MTHICVNKLTIIGWDNGLSPVRRQAIIWTNAGILLIGPLWTNFSEISIKIYAFSFQKMHLKMSSGKWQPFCLGLNELTLILIHFKLCMCWASCETAPNHAGTVETLYNTIYYSKYFIELNFDKSTQYVALWTHKRHPIPRPFGRAMECLLWVLEQKLIVL